MFEELKDINSKIKDLREKYLADDGELVKASFKALFAKYPDLTQITWCQYAPYFNDGDACVFSVHDPYLRLQSLAKKAEDGDVEEGNERGRPKYPCDSSEYVYLSELEDEALKSDFETLWESIPEDVLKALFEDDSWIFVERDKIEIEHYEHD